MRYRLIAKTCHVFMWIALVAYSAVQLLAAYGLEVNNNRPALALGREELVYSYAPLVVVTVLMWASVLLYVLVKKYRWIGLAAGGVSSVAVVVTAVDLARHFPRVISTYDEVGLTPMSLVLRHYGFLLVPMLMLLGFFFSRKAEYALLRPEKKKAKKNRRAGKKGALPREEHSDILDGSGDAGE